MAGEGASTTFTIAFQGDTAGIDQSKAALDGLRASIEQDTAALTALQKEMQNLRGTAQVARWEALPKDIKSAESEVAKLSAKMEKLKSDFAKAPEGKKEGIFAAGLQAQAQLDAATKRLGGLRGEQKKLGDTASVKLFEDMKRSADKLKQSLGENQTAFSRMGGSLKAAVKEAPSSLQDLGAGAKAAGANVDGLKGKFAALKGLGVAGWIALATVALAALAVAMVAVIAKAVGFAIGMADAARSAGLLREAVARVGKATADQLRDVTLAVEDQTAASRESITSLVAEYGRLGFSLDAIKSATTAVSIATTTMGDAAGSTIKGLIDRGVNTKRFWLGLFDLKGTGLAFRDVSTALAKNMGIAVGAAEAALRQGRVKLEDGVKALDAAMQAKFGDIAKRQMLALPVQFERLKTNLSTLFSGAEIEPFLEKLSGAVDLFKATSVVGKALKQALTAFFQPFVDSAGDSLPWVEELILEITIGVQNLVIAFLKAGGPKAIKAWFSEGVEKGREFWETLKEIAHAIKAIGEAASAVSGAVSAVTGAFTKKAGSEELANVNRQLSIDSQLAAQGKKSGEAITAGIAAGIDGSAAKPVSSILALSEAMKGAFESANKIKSPSGLYRDRAKEIPRGAALGVEDESPKVAQALQRMGSPGDMKVDFSVVHNRTENSANNSVVYELHYHGAGSRSDAQAFYQWFVDETETQALARGVLV